MGRALHLEGTGVVALRSDLTLARRDPAVQGGHACVQGHVLLLWDLTAQTSA